jgi:hypothetical protein
VQTPSYPRSSTPRHRPCSRAASVPLLEAPGPHRAHHHMNLSTLWKKERRSSCEPHHPGRHRSARTLRTWSLTPSRNGNEPTPLTSRRLIHFQKSPTPLLLLTRVLNQNHRLHRNGHHQCQPRPRQHPFRRFLPILHCHLLQLRGVSPEQCLLRKSLPLLRDLRHPSLLRHRLHHRSPLTPRPPRPIVLQFLVRAGNLPRWYTGRLRA